MQRQLCFAPEVLHIRPWPDDVIDHMGHDPRSAYVEDYWLGLLGPSTTWLLRRLAAGFEYSPEGFDLDLAETARSLGLGDRSGRHSPFVRSINRTVQFGLALLSGPEELSVRRRLPPLNRAQLCRLSPATASPARGMAGGAVASPGGRATTAPSTAVEFVSARAGRGLRRHRAPATSLALPGTYCPGGGRLGAKPEGLRVVGRGRYPRRGAGRGAAAGPGGTSDGRPLGRCPPRQRLKSRPPPTAQLAGRQAVCQVGLAHDLPPTAH